ncbi:hypothetical protein C427_1368 [Paraglaciecola psychrophila 170]|uniref:Uncharacterized protein n=1 Tax=Paraglaciecola psychrophila 170 TaxID=1129794 RepID=M4RYF9_9ALTE|nr:hypothetical protein C427_1368 [Paraglaciecola psychrophila 170]
MMAVFFIFWPPVSLMMAVFFIFFFIFRCYRFNRRFIEKQQPN